MKKKAIAGLVSTLLTVSCGGGGGGSSDTIANAGSDKQVTRFQTATLDGSSSKNANSFTWTQINGPYADLRNTNTNTAEFTPSSSGIYTFRLTTTGESGESSDEVMITVAELPQLSLTQPTPEGVLVTNDSVVSLSGTVNEQVTSVVVKMLGGNSVFTTTLNQGVFSADNIPIPLGDS